MGTPEQLTYGVMPDSHGQYERMANAIDKVEPQVDSLVFLGDVFDGPDSKRVIGLIRDLGERAITILGNHEWVYRNALEERDNLILEEADNPFQEDSENPILEYWRYVVWKKYENKTLESYGLTRSRDWDANAEHLREAMLESGDLDWLRNLPPYFETDSFVAVHAGPKLDSSWAEQAKYLDAASAEDARLINEPEQIFSHRLDKAVDTPLSVDSRTFVTGHDHHKLPIEERVAERRFCLASNLRNAALFVWFSEDSSIRKI